MRGIDGNFINAQGDATARMQLAYQAEQNRQQIKAQLESADALRKLREEVAETEKSDSSRVPKLVTDDQGSGSSPFFNQGDKEENELGNRPVNVETSESPEKAVRTHIDLRV